MHSLQKFKASGCMNSHDFCDMKVTPAIELEVILIELSMILLSSMIKLISFVLINRVSIV